MELWQVHTMKDLRPRIINHSIRFTKSTRSFLGLTNENETHHMSVISLTETGAILPIYEDTLVFLPSHQITF